MACRHGASLRVADEKVSRELEGEKRNEREREIKEERKRKGERERERRRHVRILRPAGPVYAGDAALLPGKSDEKTR